MSAQRDDYRLEGTAGPDTLSGLHVLFSRAADEHPGAREDLEAFETAVIEIAGNVVEHGGQEGEAEYAFALQVLADRLTATFKDSGRGDVPDTDDAEMPSVWAEEGRGLALAGAVLDELDVERRDGWNHWQLARRRRS